MDAEKLEKQERLKKFLDGLTTDQAVFVSENLEDLYLLADCREEETGDEGDETEKTKSVFVSCMELYNSFVIDNVGVKAKIDKIQGGALNRIIKYLKTIDKIKTDADVIKAFGFIFKEYERWSNFHKQQTKLSQIDSNLQNILNDIRNGFKQQNASKTKTDREKRVESITDLRERSANLLEGN